MDIFGAEKLRPIGLAKRSEEGEKRSPCLCIASEAAYIAPALRPQAPASQMSHRKDLRPSVLR